MKVARVDDYDFESESEMLEHYRRVRDRLWRHRRRELLPPEPPPPPPPEPPPPEPPPPPPPPPPVLKLSPSPNHFMTWCLPAMDPAEWPFTFWRKCACNKRVVETERQKIRIKSSAIARKAVRIMLRIVEEIGGVPREALTGPSRCGLCVYWRQIASYIAIVTLRASYSDTGRALQHDHTTILHGCRMVHELVKDGDTQLIDDIAEVVRELHKKIAPDIWAVIQDRPAFTILPARHLKRLRYRHDAPPRSHGKRL